VTDTGLVQLTSRGTVQSSGSSFGGGAQTISRCDGVEAGTHEIVTRYWAEAKSDRADTDPFTAVVESRGIVVCPEAPTQPAPSARIDGLHKYATYERMTDGADALVGCASASLAPHTVTDRDGVVQASWGVGHL
jgi:hypothetical protein